jgi:hypothetical protein
MNSRFSIIIHPFLFAIHPILFLFARNLEHYSLNIIVTPVLVTVCFSAILFCMLNFILADKKKSGIVVSLLLILFFSYGHFFIFLKPYLFIKHYIGFNKFLFLIWVIPIVIVIYFIVRSRKDFSNITNLFNMIATVLVGFLVIKIGTFYFKSKNIAIEERVDTRNIEPTSLVEISKTDELPNIFYIILDSYAREDILRSFMGYDNSKILDYLTQKGFYIASKSRSNYEFTDFSLASSMNLDYIPQLLGENNNNYNKLTLIRLVKNSFVVRFLRRYGYKFVAFDSGVSETQMRSADIFMAPEWSTNDFINILFDSTMFMVIKKRYNPLTYFVRRGLLYPLDHVQQAAKLDGPVFVFAHSNILHPPFLFGKNGEPLSPESFTMKAIMSYSPELFSNTLVFLNKKIKKIVDDILSYSKRKPIIILQADHGVFVLNNAYKTKERLSILNAYYLPDGGDKHLYKEISPVNTFRVIFNHYFGANYKILKDESYHSLYPGDFNFVKINP